MNGNHESQTGGRRGIRRWRTEPFWRWSAPLALLALSAIAGGQRGARAQSLPYNWAPLGEGANMTVYSLATSDGPGPQPLFVGGEFTHAGGDSASNVAAWASPLWLPLGPGLGGGTNAVRVLQMLDLEDGMGPGLYAGGDFLTIGQTGTWANRIAHWDGLAWSTLGSGPHGPGLDGTVRAITTFDFGPDGGGKKLVAAGGNVVFTVSNVAVFDGMTWQPLGTSVSTSQVHALAVYDDELYAGGLSIFQPDSQSLPVDLVKWDSAAGEWVPAPGNFAGTVKAMTVFNGDLIVGGGNLKANEQWLGSLARWDGTQWYSLGGGTADQDVRVLKVGPDGALYVGGYFYNVGPFLTSIPARHIARFDGANWSALGSGTEADVNAIEILGEGDCMTIYAGGHFISAGGNTANHVAKFTPEPIITANPQSLTRCPGQAAAFSVSVLGGGLMFQWRRNGIPIANGNGPTLVINPVAAADAGIYTVTVSNPCGIVDSLPATLTVPMPVVIYYVQSSSQTLCQGSLFSLAASADGAPPLAYQWYQNGVPISGANDPYYVRSSAQPADSGVYQVVVANACGNMVSPGATVTVNPPPQITQQPASLSVTCGAGATFSVAATGPDMTYQWYKDGVSIADATSSSYTIAAVTPADAGTYTVVATNSCGMATSMPATLSVQPCPPTIASANPPAAGQNGNVPFRDVLQNTDTALVAQGIGVAGTPPEGAVNYAPISVTFNGTPSPVPAPGNISVACTGGNCPTVTAVSGAGAGPYLISLSQAIPPRHCTTLTFAGTVPGQKLQYQSLPGDANLNGSTSGQDVLALVFAINTNSTILARHDMNRNGTVSGQDVLRLVQLLNGGASVSPSTGYNGAQVAACP